MKDAFTPWFGIIKGIPDWFQTWDSLHGHSYVFTSMATLKYVDKLSTAIEKINFEQVGENYIGIIKDGDAEAEFTVDLDDSKEAYVLKVISMKNMELYDLVSAFSVHFPKRNTSIVILFTESLADKIGGIVVKK